MQIPSTRSSDEKADSVFCTFFPPYCRGAWESIIHSNLTGKSALDFKLVVQPNQCGQRLGLGAFRPGTYRAAAAEGALPPPAPVTAC